MITFLRFLVCLLVLIAVFSVIAGLSLVAEGRYWEALPAAILCPLACKLAAVIDEYC